LFKAFILKASEGRTAPDFSLKSLAGRGRMDLIARCIVATFYTPEGPRKDAKLTIVLEGPPDPPVSLTFDGNRMRRAPISEVGVAEIIFDVLSGKKVEGVRKERKGFERVLSEYKERGFSLYYLHEEGEDSSKVRFEKSSAFILGDQKGLDAKSERLLDEVRAKRVSLGPYSYLASHCITIVSELLHD